MRKDEIINGYRILQNFTCAGGGLSKWTFAERGGREYFIKEFLRPTFPLAGAPGSERVKAKKRLECDAFEAHHKALMDAINSRTIPGGNLISTLDFFRHGAKYYKVTEKVDVTSIKPAQIARLPLSQRILIMTTIAHSLRILHDLNIVHGDLKIDNVLIKRTRMGSYTSKLIDFDDSYFSGRPPEMAEDVVGDMVFYSPELGRYIMSDPNTTGAQLTEKSDAFALGLLYGMYLNGRLPEFNIAKYRYACIAVNRGETITFESEEAPEELVVMINQMLNPNPAERPVIQDVFETLKAALGKSRPKPNITADMIPPKVESTPPPPPSTNAPANLNLKGRLTGPVPPPPPAVSGRPAPPEDIDPDSLLKGTLLNKKKE